MHSLAAGFAEKPFRRWSEESATSSRQTGNRTRHRESPSISPFFDSHQQRRRQIEENGLGSFVLAERANDERTAFLEKTGRVVNDL